MIWLLLMVTAAFGQDTPAQNKLCYPDYPIKDGLLCYKACKSGYGQGGGPVCWAECPPHTTNAGLFCIKDTYGRGAGRPLHTCPSGAERNGALCYPLCKRGYYGVGPVCWDKCKPGYRDDGLFCVKIDHIFDDWYVKKSYGRGAGSPMGCGRGEEENGALCYPTCRSGFYGVGPVCWAHCSGLTTDTGTQCQKKSYGRGVGKVLNCIKAPQLSDFGNWRLLLQVFQSFVNKQMDATVCGLLHAQLKPFIALIHTFNGCYDQKSWNTVALAYTYSPQAGTAKTIRVAIDSKSNNGSCFVDSCSTGGSLLKASINVGWFRSLADLAGRKTLLDGSGSIPSTPVGVGMDLVHAGAGVIAGLQFNLGLHADIPISLGTEVCTVDNVSNILL